MKAYNIHRRNIVLYRRSLFFTERDVFGSENSFYRFPYASLRLFFCETSNSISHRNKLFRIVLPGPQGSIVSSYPEVTIL